MTDDAEIRAQTAREVCPYLTAKQTAFHLGISPNTLRGMRLAGKGPKARRHGHNWRYHINDIEAWSLARSGGEDDA